MRAVSVLVLLALLALPPAVPAETRTGATYGVNLGYWDVGNWNTWWFGKAGTGPATITLTWNNGIFPGTDYDLLVYAVGAMDDGVLNERPIAEASTRSFVVRHESLTLNLPPTTFNKEYLIAVVAHQAQGETYTLSADPGYLIKNSGPVLGVRGYCPTTRCPFMA